MPVFAFFLVFASLASVGLPALNGFVGEFMILIGSFRTLGWLPVALATSGVVLAAIYLLKMIQLTIFGPITKEENRKLTDLNGRELAALIPLCIFMVWIGVAPDTFLKPSRQALADVLADYRGRVSTPSVTQATLRAPAAQVSSTTTEAGR